MRYFQRVAACLLPSFVASLVIPTDPFPAATENTPWHASGRPHFVHRYGHGSTLQFSLPCPDCDEEERELIEHEDFTLTLPNHEELYCADDNNTGITFNESPLVAQRLDSNGRRRWAHPSGLHFKKNKGVSFNADWELNCACLHDPWPDSAPTAECTEYGYALSVQIKSDGSGSGKLRTGFTVTYDQFAGRHELRFSPFVEDFSGHFDGVSLDSTKHLLHWASPKLKPTFSELKQPGDVSVEEADSPPDQSPATSSLPLRDYPTPTSQVSASLTFSSPIVQTEAIPLNPSSQGQLLKTIPNTQQGVKAEKSINDWNWKESLGNFEEYAIHAAQSVLGRLKQNLPECAHNRQSWQSSWHATHSKTSQAKHCWSVSGTKDRYDSIKSGNKAETSDGTLDHEHHATKSPSLRAAQLTTMILLVGFAATFVALRLYLNPRRRAEFAACREERRNMRLYRRAAWRQRCRNFVDRMRGVKPQTQAYMMPHSPTDATWNDGEKANSIVVEGSSSNAYQQTDVSAELQGIRKAQRFVEGILKLNATSSEKASLRMVRHARSYSFAESEKSILPPYQEKSEDTIFCVDGLTFVSNVTDDSPESSVIGTSSRNSYCDSSDDEKI